MGYILVGIAGAIGAILRYAIGIFFYSSEVVFPYHTLIINLIGSFLLAWFTTGLFKKLSIPLEWKVAISTGFIGSFTTFSTFSVETIQLMTQGYVAMAIMYVCLSVVGGLFMGNLGMRKKGVGINGVG